MIKTQVMLPDAVYRNVRRIAAEREIPVAELIRRGLDYMMRIYPPGKTDGWSFPGPVKLGAAKVPVTEWRILANERPDEMDE